MVIINTFKKFLENNNNSFEIVSLDFFREDIKDLNKKDLSKDYLNNFKTLLNNKFSSFDYISFDEECEIHHSYNSVYVIEDNGYTNTFTIFRTHDDMILLCYAMVWESDLVCFCYRFDLFNEISLNDVVDNMVMNLNKYHQDYG